MKNFSPALKWASQTLVSAFFVFISITAIAGIGPVGSKDKDSGLEPITVVVDCDWNFAPDPGWVAIYSGCEVDPIFSFCNGEPEIEVSGSPCFPETGNVLLGVLRVYDGNTLLKTWEIEANDGVVIAVLIEDE